MYVHITLNIRISGIPIATGAPEALQHYLLYLLTICGHSNKCVDVSWVSLIFCTIKDEERDCQEGTGSMGREVLNRECIYLATQELHHWW